MATKKTPDQTLLESLDAAPCCSVGHPGEMDWRSEPPCKEPAMFSATVHACPGIGCSPDPLLCAAHLVAISVEVSRELAKLGSRPAFCSYCNTPIRGLSDLIWNVTPLHV